MPAPHDATDRRRSVVYLDTAPRAAFDQRDEPRARLDQRNETFVPHVLAIVAGTTVDFPNNDRTYHNVFSLSTTKTFDLGRYAVGQSKSVRFDRPGIVRVFCDIHSHMSAFILVFAHRYFAVTDDEGRYRLDNVPPGTYTVVAWNEASRVRVAARRRRPTPAATSKRTSRWAGDEAVPIAHQPHLLRQRAAGGVGDRRRHLSTSTAASTGRPRRSCSAASTRRARSSRSTAACSSSTSPARRGWSRIFRG